ncbi:N-acyl amino acid synthase FeeM domain-containing protein [Ramlibacter sp.]|uniref:N-acyl amino acid synthase FeeM domain-containing protein n=1 Tax=Ramlibacter sp. TaxID=1917967 RepID=UPI003D09925D
MYDFSVNRALVSVGFPCCRSAPAVAILRCHAASSARRRGNRHGPGPARRQHRLVRPSRGRRAAIRNGRKKRDEIGFVFAFELDGELIGTIRIVPLGWQLTLTETLLPQLGDDAPALLAGDWEVGRLVLAPEYRSDVDALRHCLLIALDYARAHARVERLFATCTHVLGRLYRRFGFSVFAKEVPLLGTSKAYTLIRGAARDVSAGLGGQGAPRTQ